MNGKIPVGILGATGSVGQRFVTLLADHPWFELVLLTGSSRSAGMAYGEAVDWMQSTPLPSEVGALTVRDSTPPLPARLLFSALGGEVAGPLESELARAGHVVVSNASSHRMDPDVPLVIPEVNPGHLDLALAQQHGDGAIFANPNCSTIGLVMALKPLVDSFGVEEVNCVTLQALSGAGLPGVPSLAITDNVIPFIAGEEEKVETEASKILGRLHGDRIEPAPLTISAQCNRVPVFDGHTACVSVRLSRPADLEEITTSFREFSGEPQRLRLPSAPDRPLHLAPRPDRPQPRLDRDTDRGMAVTVGRLRPCPILDVKFVCLSHNTLRGAAGGALLLAELLAARGTMTGLAVPRSGDPS
jgi:aspartate-semialdehyde dehydrogenase